MVSAGRRDLKQANDAQRANGVGLLTNSRAVPGVLDIFVTRTSLNRSDFYLLNGKDAKSTPVVGSTPKFRRASTQLSMFGVAYCQYRASADEKQVSRSVLSPAEA